MKKGRLPKLPPPKRELQQRKDNHLDGELFAKQRAFVEKLWIQGIAYKRIAELAQKEFGITNFTAKKRITEVSQAAIEHHEQGRKHYKVQAIKRIHNQIALASQPTRDKEGNVVKPPQWGAVASLERLLADIQGTREPIRVEVAVALHTAVVECLGSMSIIDMDKLVQDYGDVKDQAALALPMPKTQPGLRPSNGSNEHSA